MVIQLQNGNIEIVNNMKDVKDLIDPALAEAIEKIHDEEPENDVKSLEEDIEELEKIKNKLDEELSVSMKQTYKLERRINNISSALRQLEKTSGEYKKSDSKRVDKNNLILRLDEIIQEFRSIS